MKFKHFLIAIAGLGILFFTSCATDENPSEPIGNRLPDSPSNPSPANGTTNLSRNYSTLSWTCDDADGDTLTYELRFGTTSNPPVIATELVSTTYQLDRFDFGTTYCWKVVADDGNGHSSGSPVWSFTVLTDRVIQYPEFGIEYDVRQTIDKPSGDIYVSDVDTVTSFWAATCNGIDDISGIEYMTSLDQLSLAANGIEDISPLSNLIFLTELLLSVNEISDLSPLMNLTGLTTLHLENNDITDVSPLSNLTGLKHLYLNNWPIDLYGHGWSPAYSENRISDISPLTSLTSLHILDLSVNEITDILPLVENPGLDAGDSLFIRHNPLSDTSIYVYIPELEARGVRVYY
ncbi:leucine-rich repeat domain-containing protein [bacterium]|nr:leucine-rich repeat domain-containing protein [bacterium]